MQVAVLGPVMASVADAPVGLGGRKDRAVLAMLALASPHLVTESELLDGLWGEEPPSSGIRAVRNQVFRLRRALREAGIEDEVIATHPGGYRLAVPPDAVDIRRAEDLAASGRSAREAGDHRAAREAFRSALDLWAGSPLADVDDLPFAAPVVVRLEELRVQLLEDRFDAELACGAHREVTAELTSAIAEHPLRERLWCQLMLALYRSGRQVEALRSFQDLRAHLDEELGLLPGPEAVALERAVAIGDPVLDLQRSADVGSKPTGARSQLPRPRTRFVGRDEDRAELPRLFDLSACVTIVGPGGVGKTRLALEVAALASAGRADGAVLVDLGAVAEPSLVTQALAVAIGVEDREGQALLERLLVRLADSDHLVLLDNCEHVIDEAAALAETVLQRCPKVNVLATSREALRIDAELVWRLAPLSLPDPAGPSDAVTVGESEAVQLFADRAVLARHGFALDDGNAAAVAQVVTQLDGIPLALELAAAALAEVEPDELAEGLRERFTALPVGRRTAPDRQRTLWATIEWSYSLLDEGDRGLLERLALFTADFSVAAATDVCDTVADAEVVVAGITRLEERSLVHGVGIDDTTPARYRLLDSVREFGRLRLAAAPIEHSTATDRLIAWAVNLAVGAGWAIDFGDDAEAARAFDLDYPNLRGALRVAIDRGDVEAALSLVASFGGYWHLRAMEGEARAWIEEAFVGPGAEEALDHHPLAILAAEGAFSLADFEHRRRCAERARDSARRLGIAAIEAVALASLGLSTSERGDRAGGRACYEEALELARTGGDEGVLACVLERLAEAQLRDGDEDLSRANLDEAAATYRRLGNRRGELWCLATVGHRAVTGGDPLGGIEAFARGLTLADEIAYTHGEGWMRTASGQAHLMIGDAGAAFASFGSAYAIQMRTGDALNVGWTVRGLVRAHLANGDLSGALQRLDDMVGVCRREHLVDADLGSLVRLTAVVAGALGVLELSASLLETWSSLPDPGHTGPIEDADLAWLQDRLSAADLPLLESATTCDALDVATRAVEHLAQLVGAGAVTVVEAPPLPSPA